MSPFQSLALALRGHFHLSFEQLPSDLQQRVNADFAPWSWDGRTSRERCQRAKQWDYENDPARSEAREGVEALTNPDSPTYSQDETQRLRGDFLPEPRHVQPPIVQPSLDWVAMASYATPRTALGRQSQGIRQRTGSMISVAASSPRPQSRRSDFLTPTISRAQHACADPYDAISVWAKLREMALAKAPPFIGGATDAGLQWTDSNDETKYFSFKNLGDRLRREKKAGLAR